MIGRRLRSSRGRVGITALVSFGLFGLVVFVVLDRSCLIARAQTAWDTHLILNEQGRLTAQLSAGQAATPTDGQVRTIFVPAGSVVGISPSDYEVESTVLPAGTDLSPSGLDETLFTSNVVFFPLLEQRGWKVFLGSDTGEPVAVKPDGSIALTSVADDAVLGPLSLRQATFAVIPIGAVLSAVLFAAVAGSSLRPVRRMTRQAALIEIGELDRRLPIPGTGDELDELAETLNTMLDRVRQGVLTERRFVADAAHELRSPVTASAALLEVALGTDDPEWEATGAQVLSEQRRLAQLVDDLVLLARLDDAAGRIARPERVMLDDLVAEEASRPFRSALQVVALEPAAIDGDRRSLERVVRNLLSNADRHASSRIDISLQVSVGVAMLHVDDDGSGIPVESRRTVFERFARLDDARSRHDGGSGIGLAIVNEVVAAHGGAVVIEDSPLGGARFTITLPTQIGGEAPIRQRS